MNKVADGLKNVSISNQQIAVPTEIPTIIKITDINPYPTIKVTGIAMARPIFFKVSRIYFLNILNSFVE